MGHAVIVYDCPDITTFQAACPFGVMLCPFAVLPSHVFVEGYEALQALALTATLELAAAPADAAH